MQTSRFIPMVVSAMLCSQVEASAADKIDGFSKLASGDMLQMRFTSGGCFHFYTYDLTFTRTNASVTAVRLELPDPRGGYRDAERRDLGKLSLSAKDLAGLDTLLAFYRTNSAAGCTTVDTIRISQIRGGKVMATETFVDASCRVCDGDVKGALSVDSLTRRLQEKKDRR